MELTQITCAALFDFKQTLASDMMQTVTFPWEALAKIKAESGPDSIALFSSARATNEENYLAQKFTRAVLGTNNVDHCARL